MDYIKLSKALDQLLMEWSYQAFSHELYRLNNSKLYQVEAELAISNKVKDYYDFLLYEFSERGFILCDKRISFIKEITDNHIQASINNVLSITSECAPLIEFFRLLVNNLMSILKSELMGEELFQKLEFNDAKFSDMYADLMSANPSYQYCVQSLEEKLVQKKNACLLEVGTGDGLLTNYVYEHCKMASISYVFSDIYLNKLQKLANRYDDEVEFCLFDINKPLTDQNFHPKKFDYIIGLDVFHLAIDVHRTIDSINQLLKPGGSILMIESTMRETWLIGFMGLFSDWFQVRENHRIRHSPLLTQSAWQEVLGSDFKVISNNSDKALIVG